MEKLIMLVLIASLCSCAVQQSAAPVDYQSVSFHRAYDRADDPYYTTGPVTLFGVEYQSVYFYTDDTFDQTLFLKEGPDRNLQLVTHGRIIHASKLVKPDGSVMAAIMAADTAKIEIPYYRRGTESRDVRQDLVYIINGQWWEPWPHDPLDR